MWLRKVFCVNCCFISPLLYQIGGTGGGREEVALGL
jgi:hypothetical protein